MFEHGDVVRVVADTVLGMDGFSETVVRGDLGLVRGIPRADPTLVDVLLLSRHSKRPISLIFREEEVEHVQRRG